MKKVNVKKLLPAVLLIMVVIGGGIYAFSLIDSPEGTSTGTASQDNGEKSDNKQQTGQPQSQPQAKPGDKTESVQSDKPMGAPNDPNIQKKPEAIKPPEEN